MDDMDTKNMSCTDQIVLVIYWSTSLRKFVINAQNFMFYMHVEVSNMNPPVSSI